MTALKTLNDFDFEDCEISATIPPCVIDGVDWDKVKNKLKQEAIKWIKELLNGTNIFWKETHPFYQFRHDVYPIVDFLKNRFNITWEDLK